MRFRVAGSVMLTGEASTEATLPSASRTEEKATIVAVIESVGLELWVMRVVIFLSRHPQSLNTYTLSKTLILMSPSAVVWSRKGRTDQPSGQGLVIGG